MAEKVTIPEAPKHLTGKAKKQWQDSYAKAHQQAQIDYPEDASAQRRAATKEANKMLAVPAPNSAKEIDALEEWQVLMRGEREIDGVKHRVCVTTDGRKYTHPIDAKAVKAAEGK
jgi:hypothetical protein